MTHSIRLIPALLIGFALLVPVQAGAIVPPRDCKYMTIKGKRYNIKADQLKCTSARKYAQTYLTKRRKPRGYKCVRGSSGSKLAFNCVAKRYNPDRAFFAIKR